MIDIRPVGHILGWLVLVLGLLMVPCILIDIYDGNPNAREFALAAVITIVTGAGIAVACAGAGPPDLDLRQGFLLTSGAWAIFPAVAGAAADARRPAPLVHRRLLRADLGDDDHRRHGDRRPRPSGRAARCSGAVSSTGSAAWA